MSAMENSVTRENAVRAAIANAKRNSLMNARSAAAPSSASAPAGFMANSFRKHPPQESASNKKRPSTTSSCGAHGSEGPSVASTSGRPASSSRALHKPSAASLNARADAWDQAAAGGDGAAVSGSLEEAVAPHFMSWIKRNSSSKSSREQQPHQQASADGTVPRPQSQSGARIATVDLNSSQPARQQTASGSRPSSSTAPAAGCSRPSSSASPARTTYQQQQQQQQQQNTRPGSSYRPRANSPGPGSRHAPGVSSLLSPGSSNTGAAAARSMATWLAVGDAQPHTTTAATTATAGGISFAEDWFRPATASSNGRAASPWLADAQPPSSPPPTAAAAAAGVPWEQGWERATHSRSPSRQAASSSGRRGSPGRDIRQGSSSAAGPAGNPWGAFGHQVPEAWREHAADGSLLACSDSSSAGANTSNAVRVSLAQFSMAPELHQAATTAGVVRAGGARSPSAASRAWSASHQLPTISSERVTGATDGDSATAGDDAEGRAGRDVFEQQDAAAALADAMLLWQRLPLQGRTPVGRDSLGAIGLALERVLEESGAPCVLGVPVGAEEPGAQEWLGQWSAAGQVQEELCIWDRLLQELCRQMCVQCHEQGALLTRGVIRTRQLLQQALFTADGLAASLANVHGHGAGRVEELERLRDEAQQASAAAERSKAETAYLKQQLQEAQEQLAAREQRMRQGRFHLISQEVDAARAKLQMHMAAEGAAKLRRHRQRHRLTLAARQEEWLGIAADVVGPEAAEQLAERLAEVDARRVLTDSDDDGDDRRSNAGQQQPHTQGQELSTSPAERPTATQQSSAQRSSNAASVPPLPGVALLGVACDKVPSAISSLLPEELDSEDGSLPPSARRR